MSKILLHGTEAICEGAIRNGCRAFFGYPITPQNEVPEYMSVTDAAAGRRLCAGGIGSGRHQHGVRRGGRGRPRHDQLFQPRRQPQTGGDLLHRVRAHSLRRRQHHARRPRSGRHPARPGRLFSGHQGRRPRRLSPHRARPLFRAGSVRFDLCRASTFRINTAFPA